MKYFSISKSAQVTTYAVNSGEYVRGDMSDVYLGLSRVLDLTPKRIHAAMCEDVLGGLTPNEERIILEAREFMSGVIVDIACDSAESSSRVFMASNLNEDRTFVWLHMVA